MKRIGYFFIGVLIMLVMTESIFAEDIPQAGSTQEVLPPESENTPNAGSSDKISLDLKGEIGRAHV